MHSTTTEKEIRKCVNKKVLSTVDIFLKTKKQKQKEKCYEVWLWRKIKTEAKKLCFLTCACFLPRLLKSASLYQQQQQCVCVCVCVFRDFFSWGIWFVNLNVIENNKSQTNARTRDSNLNLINHKGPPESLSNCSVLNQTADSIQVSCSSNGELIKKHSK